MRNLGQRSNNIGFAFEIPGKILLSYDARPSNSVFMKLNVNARFAETFPLRCFASFSMFRIENSGERIEARGGEGTRAPSSRELRGVVNKRYSRVYAIQYWDCCLLEYANTIIHTNVAINYRIFIKDMQMSRVYRVRCTARMGVTGPWKRLIRRRTSDQTSRSPIRSLYIYGGEEGKIA